MTTVLHAHLGEMANATQKALNEIKENPDVWKRPLEDGVGTGWAQDVEGDTVPIKSKEAVCHCIEGLIAKHLPDTMVSPDYYTPDVSFSHMIYLFDTTPLEEEFKQYKGEVKLNHINDSDDYTKTEIIDGLEQFVAENIHHYTGA